MSADAVAPLSSSSSSAAAAAAAAAAALPVALFVTVEIKEDRLDDFLRVIEEDAIGSRTNENGKCYRFDVLRDSSQANKFHFYEVYESEEAVVAHKATPHFALWTEFKASGGVISQTVIKASGVFYGSKSP